MMRLKAALRKADAAFAYAGGSMTGVDGPIAGAVTSLSRISL